MSPEIIETYWNVNEVFKHRCSRSDQEIIETYWNVNHIIKFRRFDCRFEIIETYWNVNWDDVDEAAEFGEGNNRNILECKSSKEIQTSHSVSEIIETYWNVNLL